MHANHGEVHRFHHPHSLKLKIRRNNLCTQCHEPHNREIRYCRAHHPSRRRLEGRRHQLPHTSRTYMRIDERTGVSQLPLPRPDFVGSTGDFDTRATLSQNRTNAAVGACAQEMVRRSGRSVVPFGGRHQCHRATGKPEGEKLGVGSGCQEFYAHRSCGRRQSSGGRLSLECAICTVRRDARVQRSTRKRDGVLSFPGTTRNSRLDPGPIGRRPSGQWDGSGDASRSVLRRSRLKEHARNELVDQRSIGRLTDNQGKRIEGVV